MMKAVKVIIVGDEDNSSDVTELEKQAVVPVHSLQR